VYENYLVDAEGGGGNIVKITADHVTVRHCEIRNGSGKAGERPGENAVDTKTKPDGPRCELKIRGCYLHGWNQPSQIGNCAALNLKENVDAEVSHCIFARHEIAFRVRGPGSRGGAHVRIEDCAIYETQVAVRAEDKIERLEIRGLAFGKGVGERIQFHGGKPAAGYESTGERAAPPVEELLKKGFSQK
jgi:hypothetical protein